MKKLSKLLLVITILTVFLTGCGASEYTESDAQKHVQAALELLSTGENTTGFKIDDQDETVAEFNKMLDEQVGSIFGGDDLNLSDSIVDKYKEFFKQAFHTISYDVGEAKKTEEGFEVPVTVHPLKLDSCLDMEAIQDELADKITSGELDGSDETAVYDAVFDSMYGYFMKALENPVYGEDYQMTVHIAKDDDGNYDMKDGEEFGEHIFSLDSIE